MQSSDTRILGLDIGTKRTGIAISNESKTIAFPLKLVECSRPGQLLEEIRKLQKTYELDRVIAGIPLNQYGESGEAAQNVRTFIAMLQKNLKVPVLEWDERLTTAQAERSLIESHVSREKRKTVIDQAAATILLQSYLDSLQSKREDDEE